MILKNKLTKETLDIPYSEFRKKFAKEIQDAFESYRKTQLNKYFGTSKMTTLWSLIFILNFIGTLIILVIATGISNDFKNSEQYSIIEHYPLYLRHLQV